MNLALAAIWQFGERILDQVDGIIIGAGVIGLAVAAKLGHSYDSILIIDRQPQVGQETSSRNSEVIHGGIYYPEGSLKANLCTLGKQKLYDYCQHFNIPHQKLGKLIVAQASDESQLAGIQAKAQANGVNDLTLLSQSKLQQLEPALNAQAALFSPSTGIIDSHAFMQSLLQQAQNNGAFFVGQSEFLNAQTSPNGFTVNIKNTHDQTVSEIDCGFLINCAGLNAQQCASEIEGLNKAFIPKLYYCRGHYFSYTGRSPFSHLIYPVPEKNTSGLGIHGTLDMAGQLRFGPDVQYIDTPTYHVSEERKTAFAKAIKTYWPGLDESRLQPAYSGIRPKLSGPGQAPQDFQIHGPTHHGVDGLVNLFGIESPGLTSSLAIADQVANLL